MKKKSLIETNMDCYTGSLANCVQNLLEHFHQLHEADRMLSTGEAIAKHFLEFYEVVSEFERPVAI